MAETVKTDGGSKGGIIVKKKVVKKVDKPEEPIEDQPAEEPIEEPTGELTSEAIEVNKALIETICVAVGRIGVAVTGIEEIAFDEDEVEQLKNLWSPFMPTISPLATAIIGTVIIVGGKVGIYAIKRKGISKKGKSAKSEKPPKTKPSTEKQQ